MWSLVLAAGAAIAQDTAPAPEPDAPGFSVIVNAATRVTELPAKTVANMFLKKKKRWDSGEAVIPVDLEPKHPVRNLFTRAVHNRSVTAVVSYWQRIIFSKGGSPPESKNVEDEVVAFVAAHPGAIGYVSDEVELVDGVRRLKIDDLKTNP